MVKTFKQIYESNENQWADDWIAEGNTWCNCGNPLRYEDIANMEEYGDRNHERWGSPFCGPCYKRLLDQKNQRINESRRFNEKPFEKWMMSDIYNWLKYVDSESDPNETRSTSDGHYQASKLTPNWPRDPVGYVMLTQRLKDEEFKDDEIVKIVNKVYISLGEQQIRLALKHLMRSK